MLVMGVCSCVTAGRRRGSALAAFRGGPRSPEPPDIAQVYERDDHDTTVQRRAYRFVFYPSIYCTIRTRSTRGEANTNAVSGRLKADQLLNP